MENRDGIELSKDDGVVVQKELQKWTDQDREMQLKESIGKFGRLGDLSNNLYYVELAKAELKQLRSRIK